VIQNACRGVSSIVISCCTSCLNPPTEKISYSIDSALSQASGNILLTVIDDGSSDGILYLSHGYGDRLAVLVSVPENRIYYVFNENFCNYSLLQLS
jgi:glycosyltransferase involved in cell wall biosynthesis